MQGCKDGLRHVGQVFLTEVENGIELDFNAIIEFSASASPGMVQYIMISMKKGQRESQGGSQGNYQT